MILGILPTALTKMLSFLPLKPLPTSIVCVLNKAGPFILLMQPNFDLFSLHVNYFQKNTNTLRHFHFKRNTYSCSLSETIPTQFQKLKISLYKISSIQSAFLDLNLILVVQTSKFKSNKIYNVNYNSFPYTDFDNIYGYF